MKFANLALLVIALGLSSGCRYQNLHSRGANGETAPYENLTCAEGDDDGFSIDVPSCVCNAGIRLTYQAEITDDGSDFLYIYESGVHREQGPLIRMESHSVDEVERLFIEGREIPRDCEGPDCAYWDSLPQSFTDLWTHYTQGPVFMELLTTCVEDGIMEAADEINASQQKSPLIL